MEENRNEEQEKGAEIRAILSFRDRSCIGLEEDIEKQVFNWVLSIWQRN